MPAGSMDGWEFTPYPNDGEARAIAALHGTEVHFCVAPEWRHKVIARRRTREFLRPMFERRGYLTTRAVQGAETHSFLTRIGFVPTWENGNVTHYMLTELPFGKER